MYRGISFKIFNKWGTLLFDILQDTSYDNYTWKIEEDEVYIADGTFLFNSDRLSGNLFKDCIVTPLYYVVFANLQAFPNYDDICEINSYNDFINSKCQLALFVCDNIFVDIYSKSQSVIMQLQQNALKHGFTEIQLLTDINDSRNVFKAI